MSAVIESTALILAKEDKHSAVWLRHAKQLEARLEMLRTQNDAFLTQDETNVLRGRISEIKLMLGLGKDEPGDWQY